MNKLDGTCGIRYVDSSGSWKIRLGGVGGVVIRLSDADMTTFVEYFEAYKYKNLKKKDEMETLYSLMEDLPRDWFDLLVRDESSSSSGSERGTGLGFWSHRLSRSDILRAKRRRVSSGYLLLKDRKDRVWPEVVVNKDEEIARCNYNISVAVSRGRLDWFLEATNEKRHILGMPKLSEREVAADWEKARLDLVNKLGIERN